MYTYIIISIKVNLNMHFKNYDNVRLKNIKGNGNSFPLLIIHENIKLNNNNDNLHFYFY